MSDLRIEGANKLGILAKALRNAGDKELQKELYAGLNRATKTLKADAKQSALDNLPERGGLAKLVAKSRMSTRRAGGRNPGVKIVAKGVEQARRIDRQGKVRHPVYGRGAWVDQKIPDAEGWFTKTMEEGAPAVRAELVKSIDEVAKKLARKL